MISVFNNITHLKTNITNLDAKVLQNITHLESSSKAVLTIHLYLKSELKFFLVSNRSDVLSFLSNSGANNILWSKNFHLQKRNIYLQQALFSDWAAKAIDAWLLDALTIITIDLL